MNDYKRICPLCNGTAFLSFMEAKDHFLTGEDFQVIKCNGCGFLVTHPCPGEKDLPAYYQSEEYISHSNAGNGIVNQLYKGVRNISLDRKVALVRKYKPSGTALDIGCGTGHYLHRLSSRGFKVTGIEPNDGARRFAREHFHLEVKEDLLSLGDLTSSFDVISLWHVLEHVTSLNDYMVKIKKLLTGSGIVLIAVPNPESYDAVHYGRYWAAWDLPRHLWHFTRVTMEKFMARHEMKLIDTLPMKFDSFYVSLLSEKYKTGKSNYLSAFFTGLKSNRHAATAGNKYSSLIYIATPKI